MCKVILTISLTACGGITNEQKGNWNATYNELKTKEEEHNQAIKEINSYFDSLSNDLSVIRSEVGGFNIKDVVNRTFNLQDDVLTVDAFSSKFSTNPPEQTKDFDLKYQQMLSSLETLNKRIAKRPSLNDIKTETGKIIDDAKKEIQKKTATAGDIVGLWGGLLSGEEYSLKFNVAAGKQTCELSMGSVKFSGIFVIDKSGEITISVPVGGKTENLIYKYSKSTDKLEANIPKLGGWTNLPRVR